MKFSIEADRELYCDVAVIGGVTAGVFTAISAKTAIDATGDGNLCQMMGYATLKSETLQPATLQKRLSILLMFRTLIYAVLSPKLVQ